MADHLALHDVISKAGDNKVTIFKDYSLEPFVFLIHATRPLVTQCQHLPSQCPPIYP